MRKINDDDKEALSAVNLLNDDTRLIREQVLRTLEDKNVSSERLVEVMTKYEKDDVKRTLPLVMCGLINTVSKQTKMRDSMRKALVELAESHGYDFDFNDEYQRFYRGEPPKDRIRNAAEVTAKFFGANWSSLLELGPKYASKAKELKIIVELAEPLNYKPKDIKQILGNNRDKRRAANPNKQGVSKFVTTEDLDMLKKDLELCKAQTAKKKKAPDNTSDETGKKMLITLCDTAADVLFLHCLVANKKQKKNQKSASVIADEDA